MTKLMFILLFLTSSITSTSNQECDIDSNNCESDGRDSSGFAKYSHSQWTEYLNAINTSLESHSSCPIDDSECVCYSQVIDSDLDVWAKQGGITPSDFAMAKEKMYGGVHYQVIKHKLYRSDNCMFGPRCKGIEHFILEIIQDLPDMELIVNVHDYPKSSRHRKPLPIFSFSKTPDYYDIMYPAWSFWSGGPSILTEPRGLGRWDEKRQSLTNAAKKWPWKEKVSVAFFRGSRTSDERDPLVLFSRDNPELVDAQYTKNQAWKSDKDTLGFPPADIVSLEDHCQYKYLFNFRGVAASFRFRHLFLCKSLVFHVGGDWIEFFYPRLKPWIHYIPVKQNLSDLRELLIFVQENDEVAKQIASRGFDMIWDHLKMDEVRCYWKHLLIRYANLISWKVKPDAHLLLVS